MRYLFVVVYILFTQCATKRVIEEFDGAVHAGEQAAVLQQDGHTCTAPHIVKADVAVKKSRKGTICYTYAYELLKTAGCLSKGTIKAWPDGDAPRKAFFFNLKNQPLPDRGLSSPLRIPGLVLMFGFSPKATSSAAGCAETTPEHYAVMGKYPLIYGANQMSLFSEVGIPTSAIKAGKNTGEIISFFDNFFAAEGAGATGVGKGIFKLKNGKEVCVRIQLPVNL